MIAERQYAVTHDLPGLMALARNQQRIALLQVRNRGSDRFRAVADFARAICSGENRGTDRLRLLAPRVIIGDNDMIGKLDLEQRALAVAPEVSLRWTNDSKLGNE